MRFDGASLEDFYRKCGRESICAYCGQPADAIDHTVPRSHVERHREHYAGLWFPKVPCCGECNSLLGARFFKRFSQRKALIHAAIRRRHGRVLSALAWSPEEIEGLGYNLRTKISTALLVANAISRRIAYSGFPVTHGVPDELFQLRRSEPIVLRAVASTP